MLQQTNWANDRDKSKRDADTQLDEYKMELMHVHEAQSSQYEVNKHTERERKI